MWISRKTDYATRAVLALAISQGERLNAQDLSRRVGVPEPFMKQILMQLRDAGVVRSERGPSGGYRLNHDPADITLERIVRIFQGQLAPIECATRHEPQPCSMEIGCSLRTVWAEVRDATIAILERTTFADLAAQAGGIWAPVGLIPRPSPQTVSGTGSNAARSLRVPRTASKTATSDTATTAK